MDGVMEEHKHTASRSITGGVSVIRRSLLQKLGWLTFASMFLACPLSVLIETIARRAGVSSLTWLPFTASVLLPTLLLVAYSVASAAAKRAPSERGQLDIEGEQLRITSTNTQLSIPLADLANGTATAHPNPLLQLEFKNGDQVNVQTGAFIEVQTFLEALQLDASKQALEVPLQSLSQLLLGVVLFVPMACMAGGITGGLAGLLVQPHLAWVSLAPSGALLALFALLWNFSSSQLTVGSDGVTLRRWGRTRFLPFHSIQQIDGSSLDSPDGTTPIVLQMTDGTTHTIHLPKNAPIAPSAVLERIRHGTARSGWRRSATLRSWIMHRSVVSLADWIEELRLFARVSATDPNASFHPKHLWERLEDLHAPLAERVAAAIALRALDDASSNDRLQTLRRTTADPTFGSLLDATIAQDNERLLREFEPIEQQYRAETTSAEEQHLVRVATEEAQHVVSRAEEQERFEQLTKQENRN